MRIGFDLDGVIIDHTAAKIKLAADLGFKITEKETPSEILKNVLPVDVLKKLQRSLYYELHPNSSLMDGVAETLDRLYQNSFSFFLISRRDLPAVAVEFLKKEDLWPKYFNETNSFFIVEKEDKDKKAKELGVTHYFDDEIGVLEKLKSVANKFLFDNHNVFPKKDFYTKIVSWKEIKKQLLL